MAAAVVVGIAEATIFQPVTASLVAAVLEVVSVVVATIFQPVTASFVVAALGLVSDVVAAAYPTSLDCGLVLSWR